jgi:hypothetical protein
LDGQLVGYTPGPSFKQTYCKGWAKGIAEGRLALLSSSNAAGVEGSSSSSSSSNASVGSTPLISILQDNLLLEIFRRLETKEKESSVDKEGASGKKGVKQEEVKKAAGKMGTEKMVLDKKELVLPLLVCKTWRAVAAEDTGLKERRNAAAAMVVAARDSTRRRPSRGHFQGYGGYHADHDNMDYHGGGYGSS